MQKAINYERNNYERKKKIKIEIPKDHVIPRMEVLEDLKKNENNDYIAWIGHATFLIKLGTLP